ncbi:hypothetical protein SDC9_123631 [bioreactor metagenome]|uniref:Uncharacterized protein n=1 Tax=bioreactor metagenome TaxID=1076179 RepID=A0A645CIM0_9ZZZZ
MYCGDGAGDIPHQRGNGHVGALSHTDVALIGVAVILLKLHRAVIHQRGHLCAFTDVLAHVQLHDVLQLPGERRGQIQARDILLHGAKLLLIAVHILPGLLHSGTGRLGIDDEERRSRRNLLALGDENLLHGAGGGQGDGLALLGFGNTAALHGGGDGVVHHRVLHYLCLRLRAAAQDF